MSQPVHVDDQGFPNLGTPIAQSPGLAVSIPWYRLFIALWQRGSPSPAKPQTIASNPFEYTATNTGTMIVSAGTVEVSRDGGINWYTAGAGGGGAVPMLGGDKLRVTYGAVPTIVFFPSL